MSRILRAWPLGLLLVTNGIAAQEVGNDARPTVTAEQVFDTARDAYGPPAPEPDCEPQQGEEIIVCAEEPEDPDKYRIRSSEKAEDDYAAATMNKGNPQTPDPCGPMCGIFQGPPTVGGLCGIGLNPCPPPPAYFVDFTKLPEAPPGSDADRIARGLTPLGNDGGIEPPVAAEDSAANTDRPEPAASPR